MASANYAARGLPANTRVNVTFMCYFHLAMELAVAAFPRLRRNSKVLRPGLRRTGDKFTCPAADTEVERKLCKFTLMRRSN